MLDIKIHKRDFDYLKESNLDNNIKGLINRNHFESFNSIHLKIDIKIGHKILSFLSDELVRVGLKENDEPNSLGLFIENIIDKFSREIYK